ncbi:hypothetical protein RHP47_11600 [Thermosynechococcus sp. QKsg1]|uniref:hypothetical protein n=1 Tax=Thermosynechococcus sp. QKsg1 TaxID=3074130 RepID=UPI0028775B41|nr:hypothetical protein [Thermosynechococcus sp. QKsg1]WNC86468.1 hypothetical protein RHP47_11600 [Thermosynechococcus sp. QKsg1]
MAQVQGRCFQHTSLAEIVDRHTMHEIGRSPRTLEGVTPTPRLVGGKLCCYIDYSLAPLRHL